MFASADDRLDADIDYANVFSSLALSGAERAAVRWTPGRMNHLYEVRRLSVELMTAVTDGLPWRAKKYWVAVAEAIAMLHELIVAGARFEDVEQAADFYVAKGVAAVTPDFREPVVRRVKLTANRIGLAPLHVQVVALADLSVSWQTDPEAAKTTLDCMHLVRRTAVTAEPAARLATTLRKHVVSKPGRRR